MRYIYDSSRDEDIEQYSGQFTESVSTQIRGEDVVLDSFLAASKVFPSHAVSLLTKWYRVSR